MLLGPSVGLLGSAAMATGCASYCGGEFDALVASVEVELESEFDEEDCCSSLFEELECVPSLSELSLRVVMASDTDPGLTAHLAEAS